MSVRNTIKIITLAGAAAMMPGVASAANPTFGDWTATGGVIANTGANCPTGFTCEVINSGDGFLQANVTEDADPSNVFVQTIITDAGATCNNATCAFSDENFVKTDGTSDGIAARQSSVDAATGFTSSTEINTGWALTGGVPSVDINQALTDDGTGTGSDGDEFVTAFNLLVNLDSGGAQTGKSMDITQDVGLGVGTGDSQQFEVRERSGDLQTTPGSTTLDGTTVSWLSGEDVMVTWISQNVDIGSIGSSVFAFQSVTNLTDDPDTTATVFSTTANDPTVTPFDWDVASDVDATFGAAP